MNVGKTRRFIDTERTVTNGPEPWKDYLTCPKQIVRNCKIDRKYYMKRNWREIYKNQHLNLIFLFIVKTQ